MVAGSGPVSSVSQPDSNVFGRQVRVNDIAMSLRTLGSSSLLSRTMHARAPLLGFGQVSRADICGTIRGRRTVKRGSEPSVNGRERCLVTSMRELHRQ